jgi:O-methyltransferase involved in polyketide biosynthesis
MGLLQQNQDIQQDLVKLAEVSNTLFIPLKGRSLAKEQRDGFHDPWARELFEAFPIPSPQISAPTVGFSIHRARVLDSWARTLLQKGGTLVQLGPGLCSRAWRLGLPHELELPTLEVDLPGVINLKRKLFPARAHIHYEAIDFADEQWCRRARELGPGPYVLVMEGVSMYLPRTLFDRMLDMIAQHLPGAHLLFDYVDPFIARNTFVLPSVYKTGARFSGNGFYRRELTGLHPSFVLANQLPLPPLYLPYPWKFFTKGFDWYSLAHLATKD